MGNLKALGVDLEELLTGDLVGTRCSTLVSVDVCASNNGKPVCCSGQDAHGLIATSCSPISVNTLQ
ncbi:hypothetical protein OF83DRAFT_1137479 [Amylostereum chailletii]|nr:hypothetical protein OF83DRAFT_1137479 [Amylostereum chailletii]